MGNSNANSSKPRKKQPEQPPAIPQPQVPNYYQPQYSENPVFLMNSQPFQTSKNLPPAANPQSRLIDIPEHEIIVTRMHISISKINKRLGVLSTKSTEYNEQIQKYINIGDKEQAYFALSKKKQIEDFIRKHKKEVAFLEKQIDRIEEVGHDVKMTEVIRDSNKVLERMIKEIDIEEVHQAKILQEEGKMRREELDELLQSCIGEDSAADAEIAKQIDDIEKSMLLHTEFKKPSQAINTKNIELGIPQHKPKQQPPKQQSQVYESVYRPFDNKEDPVPEVKKPAQKHALPSEFLLQNM